VASVRGSAFVAINRWLSERLKREGYRSFLSEMRTPVARVLSEGDVWSWYPVEYLTEVYEGIAAHLGNGNGKVLENLGGAIADAELGGAPKTRLALLPMPRVVARIPYLWSRYKDCGEFKVLSVDERLKQAVLVISGYDGGPLHCFVTRTWLERVCGLLSGSKIKVRERSCRWSQGGDACHWEVTWE